MSGPEFFALLVSPFALGALGLALSFSLLAGPLGCFVIWRRTAFFGDALGHAALLGVALALAFEVAPAGPAMAAAVFAALAASAAERWSDLPRDALLAAAAHGSLAAAVIIVFAAAPAGAGALHEYFFGDLLAVSGAERRSFFVATGILLAALALLWRPLLRLSLSRDIARSEGVPALLLEALLAVVTAAAVVLAMRLVGLLLTASLLFLPAAAARPLARSPEAMAVLGAAFAALAGTGGLMLSLWLNWPSGPSIAALSFALFLASSLIASAAASGRLRLRPHQRAGRGGRA